MSNHYVYLYRDPETHMIRYVGKGTGNRVDAVIRDVYEFSNPDKMAANLEKRDKIAVRKWFAKLQGRGLAPTIELVYCDDDNQSQAVEAALISALWDTELLNNIHGNGRRFTPLGLPHKLTNRRYAEPLSRQDIASLGGAIVVYVSASSFYDDDPRKGSTPRLAISEFQKQKQRDNTHARIRRWWQIGQYIEEWAKESTISPAVVLGVTGPPSRRWIWGSLTLDNRRWGSLEPEPEGLYELPAKRCSHGVTDNDLDAKHLRGRQLVTGEFGGRITPNGQRQFNSIRPQQFDVVTPTRS